MHLHRPHSPHQKYPLLPPGPVHSKSDSPAFRRWTVEDKDYWEQCKKEIENLPANIQVEYLGARRNDELMELLRQHHLFVLPTTGENFGHSIFEALVAGRPVLISDQTPWLNLTAGKIGWDLPLANPAAFTRVVEDAAAWNQEEYDLWAKAAWAYARDFIRNPELQRQYIDLFR